MAALATPIVLTFYGNEWRPSISPLVFVALWTGLASLASMPGAVFKALGRSWLLTATGVMQLAILFPAIWFAAPHGIAAVAFAQVVEKTISLGLLGAVIGRVLRIPWYSTYLAAAPALVLSAVMAGVVWVSTRALAPLPALLVGLVVGVACYAALLRWFMPDVFSQVTAPLRAWRSRRHAVRAVAGAQ
jgi:O-antigen/teichoic acid export membrane protein